MKKFLLYSTGLTIITLTIGILTVFGFFDVSDGQTNLIGNIAPTTTEVDVHNHIVDSIHRIGLRAKDAQETMQSLTPQTPIDELQIIVDSMVQTQKDLDQYIESHTFKRNKQTIQHLCNTTYFPALIQYEYGYRKFFSFASSKALDQKKLDTFKQTITNRFAEYQQAHNMLVDELNRVRRY
ncbi:hypothetical protein GF369_01485 [Candidatus Peregrinibacteria bacterium]|nr:hypothetical protein [Candidatus Peregrinibacteria bacterium]